jgi:hypothetical protein
MTAPLSRAQLRARQVLLCKHGVDDRLLCPACEKTMERARQMLERRARQWAQAFRANRYGYEKACLNLDKAVRIFETHARFTNQS